MANQLGSDTVPGVVPGSGQPDDRELTPDEMARIMPGSLPDPGHTHAAFHGRPISWVAVSLMMVGFLVGGLALVFGPSWVVFWVGAGLVAIGGLLALATDIFEDWY
ncbi:MAG TPA: hypothetical protein VFJ03_04380 [Candidatus Limnocylindria bacterium]|nr:hypothetical protein [Candidatus Limnocylindria bacterium]